MTSSQVDNRRGLSALLIFSFFMAVGFEMIMPLIIGYYVATLGFPATLVAVALAVRQFSQQGLAMVGGALADRFDIRTLISSGVLLRAVGFSSLAIAHDYNILLLSMVLIGFGGVLFDMPYQAAIANLTTEENRPKYYSLNNTVIGVASTIGPLVGVLLLRFDFSYVCYGAALCFFINFCISRLVMPPIIRSRPSYPALVALKTVGRDKPYLTFTVLMIVFWLPASQINISFPLKAQEISGTQDAIGMMWAIYAGVSAVFQYPLVALMLRKYSPRQIIVTGLVLVTAALMLMAFADSLVAFMAVVVIYAFGMLLVRPNQQSMAVTMANPGAIGMYLGVNSLTFALGNGAGIIIGGVFFDIAKKTGLGMIPWFMFAAVCLAVMVGFAKSKNLGKAVIVEAREQKSAFI